MASKPERHGPQTELDSVPLPSHLYHPLPTDEPHIRLLELSPGEVDSQIEGKLSVHKLSEAPAYSAVSYVWGDPQPTVSIKINGLPGEIGSNCNYALWQLRSLGLAKFYWIDALCINQENLDEKSIQVWFMGQVFETAQRVFACVGPHSEDSPAFMDNVRVWPDTLDSRLCHWNANLQDISLEFKYFVDLWQFEEKLAQNSEIKNSLFLLNSEIKLHDFCIAAANFCRRAYWYRLWIVQEVTLAREILLICGLDTMDWKRFSALILSNYVPIKILYSFLDCSSEARYNKMRRLDSTSNVENIVNTRMVPRTGTSNRGLMRLVQRFRNLQCSNPLDRVYGFLHLLAKGYPSEKRLVPDYKQSPLHLALQCLDLLDLDRLETGQQWCLNSAFLISVGALMQALELDRQQSEAWILIRARQRYFSDLCTQENTPMGMQFDDSARDALLVTSDSKRLAEEYIVLYTTLYSSALIHQSEVGEVTIDYHISCPEASPLEALYSAALSYAKNQAAASEAPLNLKPKGLHSSAGSTALICSRARPGDYCIRFRNFLQRISTHYHPDPCLVVRRCGSSRLFEIIGQGFLAGLAPLNYDPNLKLTFYFSKEDFLTLAVLETWEDIGRTRLANVDIAGMGLFNEDERPSYMLQADRLFTAPTNRAFSSFAIEGTDPIGADSDWPSSCAAR